MWDKFWDDPQREFGGIFTVQNFKNGEGFKSLLFPSHPKGRGDVGSRFLCLCDRSELENGRADGAGTDIDYAVLITRNVWQSLAYSPLGAVVSPPSDYL